MFELIPFFAGTAISYFNLRNWKTRVLINFFEIEPERSFEEKLEMHKMTYYISFYGSIFTILFFVFFFPPAPFIILMGIGYCAGMILGLNYIKESIHTIETCKNDLKKLELIVKGNIHEER
jgi:hypothetical protein